MAKKLMINCGTCDARNVSEETLAAYEQIVINCGGVLVSPESKDLLTRYGVTMNCGNVIEIEKDVKLSTINGSHQIRSGEAPEERTYLMVNGSLEIGPNTQEALEKFAGIQVNGSVTYPESLSSHLGMLHANGSTICYPDDAIVLKRSAVIDKLFALRAKNKLYWSARRMIMVDEALDASVLEKKGASFSSKEVILAESKVESMIGLIDEKAEITIVPDGTAVITDDVELSELTVKKYGTKLFILGDLDVLTNEEGTLEKLEYLNVRGDVSVTAELKGKLMEVLTEIEGDVKVVRPPKGRRINDKMSLKISRWMLEQEKDGIHVCDCMKVTLDEDIPADMILEKLSISDCMEVKCSPEQEAAVGMVCEDVMAIGGLKKMVQDAVDSAQETTGSDLGIGDMLKGAFGAAKDALNTKVINAGDYVL